MTEIVFGLIAVIAVGVAAFYRQEVKSITKQLRYVKEHDTNKVIQKQVSTKEFTQLTEELNLLLKEYRTITREYGAKEEQLKSTITNISHDIRTPLTSLDGYFQLLKECEDESEKSRYYGIISARIASLREILEQLFTYLKLQNESYQFELEPINMNQTICDVLFAYYDEFTGKGIEPEVSLPENVMFVEANEIAVKRVIQNIIKNVMDHGQNKLQFSLEKEEDYVVLSIANGILPGEEIEADRVFERFYRGDEARSQTSTGLGLAIAKEMVEKMGGTIGAAVTEEQFRIRVCLKAIQ